MKVSILSISAGNNISPKNKLTTNLCACEVPNFFIKNQVVSDTLLSDPMIQLSTLCGTPTTQTCAIVKTGTHLYFVKGLYYLELVIHTAWQGIQRWDLVMNEVRHLSIFEFLFLMPKPLFYWGLYWLYVYFSLQISWRTLERSIHYERQ